MVRFTVGRGGEVLSAAVVQSSGSPTLDTAALAMLRGARVPPFTADMGQTRPPSRSQSATGWSGEPGQPHASRKSPVGATLGRVREPWPVPKPSKPSTADQLGSAARACEARGSRLTETREAVLALVIESAVPVGAYALLDRLRARKSNATPATVYRALDFLVENGLVHKLERLNAFVPCSDDGGHHGHEHSVQFLICRKCGTVAEMEDGTIAQAISRAAGETRVQAGRRDDRGRGNLRQVRRGSVASPGAQALDIPVQAT